MPSTASNGMTVYIVDDEERVRDGLCRLLRSANLLPRPYDSVERFLSEIHDEADACILLDITMPHLSGLDVQQRLNDSGIRMPVITLSAHDDDDIRDEARRLGARMFLCKPVDDQALLDAISWVIGRSRLKR